MGSRMSDPQRREFLLAAGLAALTTQPAIASDPSFMNNVPDPVLSGKDLPTFKFALEKSAGKVIGNSYGKEATVEQLPISKGIAGRLDEARARRDARAALARDRRRVGLRHRRARAHHGDRSRRACRDQRLRSGRRLVFSARPRPHAAMPRRQTLSFHPDLRQRLFLRVRHVQHHRLDRAHAKATARQDFRAA